MPTFETIMKDSTVLYTFDFNTAYNIIADNSDQHLDLLRVWWDAETESQAENLFDIADNFRQIQPQNKESKSRYITSGVKGKIKHELMESDRILYERAFNSNPVTIPPEPRLEQKIGSPVRESDLDKITESIKAMSDVVKDLAQSHTGNPYEDAIVQAIIEKGKNISTESILEPVKPELDEFIKSEYGTLPTRIEITQPDKDPKKISGIFHKKFDMILKIVSRNVPLMLVGPAGSGKNHTLEQVAEALDLDFYFTNAITQEYALKGFIDANGNYHETEFYKAFVNGGLFFLDEIDASIPEALIILNAAIANRYFDFPNGRVDANENFRVVSAANTNGNGANDEYVGRSQLDGATLDRFAQIEFDYDPDVESQLAHDEELYNFIVELRKAVSKAELRYIVSMRATINTSKLYDLLDFKTLIETTILKGMTTDDMRLLLPNLKKTKWSDALRDIVEVR